MTTLSIILPVAAIGYSLLYLLLGETGREDEPGPEPKRRRGRA